MRSITNEGNCMPNRQSGLIATAALLCLCCGAAAAAVPVIEATPACDYAKLGTVTAETGTRIDETSLDKAPSSASYPRAFERLAKAAQAVGANAVVLRKHRATYFTRLGKRSREAVHIDLSGAAIRIEGDMAQCQMVVLDPNDYRRSQSRLELVETTSEKAYGAD
ncbi:hypothetical protein [Pseudomonas sp. CGJS7]|uniref:hypothetical protein n=1 Tax=Pseudomonas sp. CGJS7 TaxID=3109348 RepID=UPI00300A2E16